MLTKKLLARVACRSSSHVTRGQRGVVLLVALIILVALTLGGIALVRSIDTTALVAGNLAFQQAATRSGEAGTEAAISRFLNSSSVPISTLWTNSVRDAYVASAGPNPNSARWWENHWQTNINPNGAVTPGNCSSGNPANGRVCVLPTDAAGNTAAYTIERLCRAAGDPLTTPSVTGCSRGSAPSSSRGSPSGPDDPIYFSASQSYYRITTRVAGPRNTLSFIQTIIAR